MLESPAWKTLSLSGLRVLFRVEIELAHHGGEDNGKLPVTYADFEAYGIHRHSIAPAIREAVALGFLRITEVGRAGDAEWRRSHRFELTYRSDEWRRIRTSEDAERSADEARKPVRKAKQTFKTQCRNPPPTSPPFSATENQKFSPPFSTTTVTAKTDTTVYISGRRVG
jgi:hypothetical protein